MSDEVWDGMGGPDRKAFIAFAALVAFWRGHNIPDCAAQAVSLANYVEEAMKAHGSSKP